MKIGVVFFIWEFGLKNIVSKQLALEWSVDGFWSGSLEDIELFVNFLQEENIVSMKKFHVFGLDEFIYFKRFWTRFRYF